ncbi:MAG: adenylate kinase [Acidobacteria bacterium]|nr:adenylate kinase [Acidobacteriota bacterium]
MALNLIMLGPPGAGKGTQAERFATAKGIPRISTGDILREAVQAGTELGKRAKAIMERGELVSDEIMIGIVRERLARDDVRAGFILDGFPRTVPQAKALDGIMAGRDPLIVLNIDVADEELVRRLTTRMICKECGTNAAVEDAAVPGSRCKKCGGAMVQRADDSVAVIIARLKTYQRDTKPLVNFYGARPTYRSVNGAQPPDQVAADLIAAIAAVSKTAPSGAHA